jgi:GNAT superfamily N-acetyltransferase
VTRVIVRDARADERAAVRALTLRAYAEYAAVMAPAGWAALDGAVRAALDGDAPAERLVAERDGALVGSVMLFAPASDAYGALAGRARWPELRLLAVAPEGRGAGVGAALVRECARRARAAGAAALGLHTSASMATARRMYERLGFVRAPEHDFRPDGAELVEAFQLPLAAAPPGDARGDARS